ncbi:hypothetical protein DPSP01_002223 [Paraphaeosphaeria sporulosa]
MQFSIILAAFAAAASAQYTYSNGTTSAVAPSGTAAPTGTGSAAPSSTAPFEGAAVANGPAMALLFGAGAAALMI